jgi:Na+/phosphate symporter
MVAKKTMDFSPIREKLVAMIGAARDAFNRHSRASLEQFKTLEEATRHEIAAAKKKVGEYLAQSKGEEKDQFNLYQKILTALEGLVTTLAGLREPIQKKVKDSVLFSEKAVLQTNCLFDTQTGLIRSIFDIIQTNNDYLKKFVREEGGKVQKDCADYATEHETRLVEGLCTPQAAPIFLAILEQFRSLGKQEAELVQHFQG